MMENFILKGLLALMLVSLVFVGPMITEWCVRRDRKKAIKAGHLRMISHAEYNRAFGIKNELKRVK